MTKYIKLKTNFCYLKNQRLSFHIFYPRVDRDSHLLHMEKSNFENIRLVESIFIQEPEELPVEKSYFPALAVIKLNRVMITEDNELSTIIISPVFGILSHDARNNIHYSQFFDSKKLNNTNPYYANYRVAHICI